MLVKGEVGLTPKTKQDLPSIQIWILKYHSPVKVTKFPWRNSLILGGGGGGSQKMQDEPEAFVSSRKQRKCSTIQKDKSSQT